ncbi:MAG: methyltransferase domain-containing protein [Bryobacterales bacterium]|nr:methyltransferase domain-containing protein [Bryobacterales bacterium]
MAPADDLTSLIRGIRERVRARYPQPSSEAGVAVPDLMPLLHARDAAEGKVAAIGTVNPRPPGFLNALIQGVKKTVARALDWHVREQVEFNRNAVACVNATLEALNEMNRALLELAALRGEAGQLRAETQQLEDIRSHWAEWRAEWERKLASGEALLLRALSEQQAAYQHRLTLMEQNFRELARLQHSDFEKALERNQAETARRQRETGEVVQQRFWNEVEKARLELEATIHRELRLVRQRMQLQHPPAEPRSPAAPPPGAPALDFADRFRGSEQDVRERQRFYLPYFEGHGPVLDLGCGRGEFLELMRDAGIDARGIDLSPENVALCRNKSLRVAAEDLFTHLSELPEGSLGGIFCAQVVEHLPPARLPELVRLAAARLRPGGLLAIETPNPECLAIFSTHFYLDPTHTRPVPSQLLAFYMQEYGLGLIEVVRLSPAADSLPGLGGLPADFRDAFFGGLDYAIFGRKLA